MVKIKLIEQIKFKLQGRAVPVIRAMDVESDGRINTIQLVGNMKKRENSLLSTWDNRGDEVVKGQKLVTVIDEKGNSSRAYIVHGGVTTDIYTTPQRYPDREGVIGAAATMDDLRDAMDINASMRDKMIFLCLGMLLGWVFLAPMMSKVMS